MVDSLAGDSDFWMAALGLAHGHRMIQQPLGLSRAAWHGTSIAQQASQQPSQLRERLVCHNGSRKLSASSPHLG